MGEKTNVLWSKPRKWTLVACVVSVRPILSVDVSLNFCHSEEAVKCLEGKSTKRFSSWKSQDALPALLGSGSHCTAQRSWPSTFNAGSVLL